MKISIYRDECSLFSTLLHAYLILVCTSMHAAEILLPFEDKYEKYGYCDEEGNVQIDCCYDFATVFAEGVSVVSRKGEEFYIDESGSAVLDQWRAVLGKGESNRLFSNGVAWLRRRGSGDLPWTFYCIERNGAVVSAVNVDYMKETARVFDSYLVVNAGDRYAIYNSQGNVCSVRDMKHLSVWEDGYCTFLSNVDRRGIFRFGAAEDCVFFPGETTALTYDSSCGIVSCAVRDQDGIDERFYYANGAPLPNIKGNAVPCDKHLYCQYGMIGVLRCGKYGVMSVDGVLLVPAIYDGVNIGKKYIFGYIANTEDGGSSAQEALHFHDRNGVWLCAIPEHGITIGREIGDWCELIAECTTWVNPRMRKVLKYDVVDGKVKCARLAETMAAGGQTLMMRSK